MDHPICAVIFDMYETLVTQLRGPLYFGTQIAQDLGVAPEDFLPGWRQTEADRSTGKLTLEEVLEQLMRQHGVFSPELHQKIVEKRVAIQTDCFRHLHPEILPLLSKLKSRGIKTGLITNCFSEEAKLIRESELFPYFDAPCLSFELGIRKPDSLIFRKCVEALDVPPENCLYVGDGGAHELETAISLGMQAVQAVWYRQENKEQYQSSLRSEFSQAAHPLELLRLV